MCSDLWHSPTTWSSDSRVSGHIHISSLSYFKLTLPKHSQLGCIQSWTGSLSNQLACAALYEDCLLEVTYEGQIKWPLRQWFYAVVLELSWRVCCSCVSPVVWYLTWSPWSGPKLQDSTLNRNSNRVKNTSTYWNLLLYRQLVSLIFNCKGSPGRFLGCKHD